jgi:hypothetical protein
MDEETRPMVSMEELQLATRNHGMPLEALRYPVTPVGLHYLRRSKRCAIRSRRWVCTTC